MLKDQLFELTQGFLPQLGGQAISGATPIVMTMQGPFNASVSMTLFSTGTVTGTWKIEASNDYLVGGPNQPSNAGHWTDITAAFRTPNAAGAGAAIVNPTGAALATYVEYMGNPGVGFGGKALQVTFTPVSGAGNIGIAVNSNRP